MENEKARAERAIRALDERDYRIEQGTAEPYSMSYEQGFRDALTFVLEAGNLEDILG